MRAAAAAMPALFSLALLAAACTAAPAVPPPDTVARIDLGRYAGTWYEIARFPNGFQDRGRRCEAVTATYTPQTDGTIAVLNRCRDMAAGGRDATSEGTARPVEGSGNAKLRVSFFWPFYGDYWVIGLGPDYRWAVVGTPDRDLLWVLSRTPAMRAGEYSAALAIARREGFDTSRLVPTPQPGAAAVTAPGATPPGGRRGPDPLARARLDLVRLVD
jgi:apolipoprotein D and lipocalin family protein